MNYPYCKKFRLRVYKKKGRCSLYILIVHKWIFDNLIPEVVENFMKHTPTKICSFCQKKIKERTKENVGTSRPIRSLLLLVTVVKHVQKWILRRSLKESSHETNLCNTDNVQNLKSFRWILSDCLSDVLYKYLIIHRLTIFSHIRRPIKSYHSLRTRHNVALNMRYL